jgi:hypothetical protein
LKLHNGARYQLSVLQVVAASQEHRIEEFERLWKRKLLSRERALNRN